MKTTRKLSFRARLALGIAVGSGAFIAVRTGYAQSLHSASASPVATPIAMPSLLMEGRGEISPSANPCIGTSCTGTFTATLTGRPFGRADVTLQLTVNRVTDEFIGCNQTTGTGGINGNAYIVNLVGQLCAPGVGYTLSGTMQIYAPAASSTAAVGTLLAFGGTNIPSNPLPNSGPSLVSLIGVSGNIPLLLP